MRDELERLFEVVRNNKTLEPEFRLKAVRILFSNTFKSKSLSLSDSLTYLKSLLECCLPEEQKWIVRSFSVVGKHIERNDSTELAIRISVSSLLPRLLLMMDWFHTWAISESSIYTARN